LFHLNLNYKKENKGKKYENEENASELEIEDQVNKLILINSDNKEKEIL